MYFEGNNISLYTCASDVVFRRKLKAGDKMTKLLSIFIYPEIPQKWSQHSDSSFFQSYESLRHITKLSQLVVPDDIRNIVEPLRGNDDAIRNYGVHQATTMIKDLFATGYAPGRAPTSISKVTLRSLDNT